MPTYEYECASCGKNYEKIQSMSDEADTICQYCGKRVRRVIHGGSGIIFKGSGFYVNDSRKNASASVPSDSKKSISSTETSAPSDSKKSESGAADTPKVAEPCAPAAKTGSKSKDNT